MNTRANHTRLATERPITIAVLAMGGQGGGALTDWIVALAEAQGWHAQSTSVPGVAQRTGATVYYIELLAAHGSIAPVFALMPTPGDVDIVLAAEWMEAGRAMLRGLVTPEKTMLIASNHRSYAVTEKEKPGEGLGDPLKVAEASAFVAKRTIVFDMQKLADANGSVISAALFGALAASKALPFSRAAFEAIIGEGGKGVAASLKTFDAAHARASLGANEPMKPEGVKTLPELPASADHPVLEALLSRLRTVLPGEVHAMAFAGLKRVLDFQDAAYAHEYLDRLARLFDEDHRHGGATHAYAFTAASAKYLANAMAYDDVIRVADLKTRGDRFMRIHREIGLKGDQLAYFTEYLHPRGEEIVGLMPARLGRFVIRHPGLFHLLDRLVNRGRRVRTATIPAFLTLYLLAGLRRTRRMSLRHGTEMAHLAHWLEVAFSLLPYNYPLAVEAIACRRLVKGYSDTHARGLSKFDRVLAATQSLVAREDGAIWMKRLVKAALLDENGKALDGALKTIATL